MDTEKIVKSIRFMWGSLNYLFWPAVCINCGERITDTKFNLCGECFGELLECTGGDYCRRCGKEAGGYAMLEEVCSDCRGKEIHFDRIARAGVYAKALQKMILAFKLADKTELNKSLGFLADSALRGSDFFEDIDFFVPVPLHWSRRVSRGYNQAKVLAGKLSRDRGCINTDLVRIRRTRTQPTMVSASRRAKNVAGAFAVRRGHGFGGRRVCLIDDIKTSGATLNECARVLKEAGAKKVFALVLAVAGQ